MSVTDIRVARQKKDFPEVSLEDLSAIIELTDLLSTFDDSDDISPEEVEP